MAQIVSMRRPQPEEFVGIPLGTLADVVLRRARLAMNARIEAEEQFWRDYVEGGNAFLNTNTKLIRTVR